ENGVLRKRRGRTANGDHPVARSRGRADGPLSRRPRRHEGTELRARRADACGARPENVIAMSTLIGRTLSHYEIVEEISRGGMGVVYRAIDTRLGREVALKVLPPELVADPERRQRFVQEARAASALEHPHIAVIHEIDEVDGISFIAMELVRGEKLSDVLARG